MKMKQKNTTKKLKKSNRGITLIALVITIIILLILVGITVASLTGNNGLIGKSGEAKNATIEAENLEKVQTAVLTSFNKKNINTTSLAKKLSQINNLTDINNQKISENTEITLPFILNLNNVKYMITEDGDVVKSEYCKNGLVLYLDGINNTRNGHSTTTTTWEDLSGNNNDFSRSASSPVWSDNSFVGNGSNRTMSLNKALLENASECTVEVCYDIPKLKDYYWVFQSRQNNPANGFQFYVSSTGRNSILFVNSSTDNRLTSFKNVTELGKRTMAFAVNSSSVTFSDNGDFYSEDTKEGIINSLVQRSQYIIGSAAPWAGGSYCFEGNIYSIRVYNKKLTNEELKNNYAIDKARFNMD